MIVWEFFISILASLQSILCSFVPSWWPWSRCNGSGLFPPLL